MSKITSVIPTYNNLPFLKLTVQSIRQNCYYQDQPIIIFAACKISEKTPNILFAVSVFSFPNL